MKNTLLFTYRTNILVRLLTLNMKNFYTPKIRKCATPFQRHILIRKCPPPPPPPPPPPAPIPAATPPEEGPPPPPPPLGYDRLS